MKKIMLAICCCILLCACIKKPSTSISDFKTMTLAELDQKIVDKQTFTVYLGFVDSDENSSLFQNNYLFKEADINDKLKTLLIINLDEQLPNAAQDEALLAPVMEAYEIAHTPAFLHYEEGKLIHMLAWTPKTADERTGLPKSELDEFFRNTL